MIVGRNPGRQEDAVGIPFVGPGGQLLDEWIAATGWERSDFIITNLVKCYTTNDRPPTDYEINVCTQHHLFRELAHFEPQVVIPLGKQALHRFVPGVSLRAYHGEWFPTRARTIFFVHHPGYVLRGGFPKSDWLETAKTFGRQISEYLV
jgi:DNA polymerase